MVTLAIATARARNSAGTAVPDRGTLGSGTIVAAVIAVKCRPQIAATIRPAPASFTRTEPSRRVVARARLPSPVPAAKAARTRPGTQVTRPATSKAAMPVKCMAPTPSPIWAPPSQAAAGRPGRRAIQKPAAVMPMPISRDSPVRPRS